MAEQPAGAAPMGTSPGRAGAQGRCRPSAARGRAGARRARRGGDSPSPPCPCPPSFPFPSPAQPSPVRQPAEPCPAPAPPPPCRARAAAPRCCCWGWRCPGCCRPGPATSPPGARWTPGRCPPGLTRRNSASSSTGACSQCRASAASGSGEQQAERSGGTGAAAADGPCPPCPRPEGSAALGAGGDAVLAPRTAVVWVGAPLQADRGAQVCGKGSVCARGHGLHGAVCRGGGV